MDLEQVVGYDIVDRDSPASRHRARHVSGRRQHRETVERPLGPPLLHDAEQRVGHEHDAEQRVAGLAEHEE